MKKILAMVLIALLAAAGGASATLYTNYVGTVTALPVTYGGISIPTNVLNFASTAGATGDIFEVIGVPSNSTVLAVAWNVLTTNTSAGTFEIGDSDSATRYVVGQNMNACGPGAATNSVPYVYTADKRITVKVQSPLANGKLLVWAIIARPYQ